jgi:copper chaperone CopZ
MKTKLSIHGMSCGHCVGAVRDALSQVPGVETVVDVDLERAEAIVEGQPDTDHLVAAVVAAGYEAKVA